MKRRILFAYALGVSLLLAADLYWRGWPEFRVKKAREVAPFQFVHLETNHGVGIIDSITKKPLWTKLEFPERGWSAISYYFDGRDVMCFHVKPGRAPQRDVSFYDTNGHLKVLWGDRSGASGLFTDRVLYDEGEPRKEVWCLEQWYPVVERDGRKGIMVDGTWRRIKFTNDSWSIVPLENTQSMQSDEGEDVPRPQ